MAKKHVLDLVVFDFDGVIADTVQDIATAANEVLRHYRMPAMPVSEVRSHIGGGAEALVRGVFAARTDVDPGEAAALFRESYRRCFDQQTALFPGVAGLLETLASAGIGAAIATNKVEVLTTRLLDKLGIRRHFRMVVGPESVTRRKPDPEAVELILHTLGVTPERTLVVGDAPADILCGRGARTRTCAALYGYGDRAALAAADPDFFIGSIHELAGHIAIPSAAGAE